MAEFRFPRFIYNPQQPVEALKTLQYQLDNFQREVFAHDSWTAPSLVSSWANYGAGSTPAGYYKDPFSVVRLKGLVKSGGVGSTIFTLPVGYRPTYDWLFCVATDTGYGVVKVHDTGVVQAISGGNGWFSLANVCFRADDKV